MTSGINLDALKLRQAKLRDQIDMSDAPREAQQIYIDETEYQNQPYHAGYEPGQEDGGESSDAS